MLPLHCSTIIHHTAAQQRTAITLLCMSLNEQIQTEDLVLLMLHPGRIAFNPRLLLQ